MHDLTKLFPKCCSTLQKNCNILILLLYYFSQLLFVPFNAFCGAQEKNWNFLMIAKFQYLSKTSWAHNFLVKLLCARTRFRLSMRVCI